MQGQHPFTNKVAYETEMFWNFKCVDNIEVCDLKSPSGCHSITNHKSLKLDTFSSVNFISSITMNKFINVLSIFFIVILAIVAIERSMAIPIQALSDEPNSKFMWGGAITNVEMDRNRVNKLLNYDDLEELIQDGIANRWY